MSGDIKTWIDGDIAHVLLNDPEHLNPIGPDQWRTLRTHLALAEQTAGVRAMVIRSTGRFFCAGNDLKVIRSLQTVEQAREYFLDTQLPTLQALAESPLPIVCGVQADSAGGGIELALYCDVVVAASEARFFLPETNVGLFATTVVAPSAQAIGRQVLQRLALAGDRIDAQEACNAGLVHRVVPRAELDEAVSEVLNRIRKASPAGVAATKASINAPLLRDGMPLVREALIELTDRLLLSDDTQQALEAFANKQSAAWRSISADQLRH